MGLSLGYSFSGVFVTREGSPAVQQVWPLPSQENLGKASFLLRDLQVPSPSCSSTVLVPLTSETVPCPCSPHSRGEPVLFYTDGIFQWFPLILHELLCVVLCASWVSWHADNNKFFKFQAFFFVSLCTLLAFCGVLDELFTFTLFFLLFYILCVTKKL